MSSPSFSTYVNLFSLRERTELEALPAIPTRCIAEDPEESKETQDINPTLYPDILFKLTCIG